MLKFESMLPYNKTYFLRSFYDKSYNKLILKNQGLQIYQREAGTKSYRPAKIMFISTVSNAQGA